MSDAHYYIGLMSGTSMDAVDAALVAFGGDEPQVRATHSLPLDGTLIEALRALAGGAAPEEIETLGRLDVELGRLLARAATGLLERAGVSAATVRAIGSHGQTIRHRPGAAPPFTLQIGDPSTVAELTGITTVADFRRRDLAAGGQGAPLAPALHAALWRSGQEDRAVLNLGGIANLTVLPCDPASPVVGFDAGPGNTLMDAWVRDQRGEAYDAGGAWAASGRVQPALLKRLLDDPYFAQAPPKSTGPEHFNLEWLRRSLAGREPAPAETQATLCELTAVSVARAIERHAPSTARLLVCGGGARNARLLARLTGHLAPRVVEPTDAHGLPAEWVEAVAFAWLARETVAGRPGNLPSVTGARHPAVLGAVYCASN